MRASKGWSRYFHFWGRDPSRDLDDELRFHLEARYDEYIAAGMDPATARAEAERRFGDFTLVRERCTTIDSQWERERAMSEAFHVLAADVRLAFRQLRRTPSLGIAAVLCFALGIGANTSIFSVVDAVLFRPLPFPDPNRLVLVGEELPQFGGGNFGVISAPEYADFQRLEGRVFENVAIYENTTFSITGHGEPERVSAAAASASLFKVLRVNAARGRAFLPGDDAVGAPSVAVLSDAFWRHRFGADSSIIGQTIGINGVSTTIVGIMPAGFAFPLPGVGGEPADVFSPYWITPAVAKSRGNSYNTFFVGRLASGVTLDQAKRGVEEIAGSLTRAHPGVYGNRLIRADAFPLHDRAVGEVQRSMLVLLAAVGLVLLIACINVSSLLLAHAAARQRELSIRRALGASRGRLARQFLTESLVLVIIGAALGVTFAIWGSQALVSRAPQALVRGYHVSVDGRVLAVTALIVIVTAIVISLLPVFQQPERALADALREEGRAMSGGPARQRGRRTLVLSEIALATIMVTGAGLMVRSLINARNVDPGFDPTHLAGITLGLHDYRYPTSNDVVRFERDMIDRLREIPGVSAVSASSNISSISFSLDGRDLGKIPSAAGTLVYPGYFETLRIPVRAGQTFNGRDITESPRVAIINETLARKFLSGSNPIGQRIKWGSPTSTDPWCTIVAVVGDVKATSLDASQEPMVYFPALQADSATVSRFMRSAAYVVRTGGEPAAAFGAIRQAVRSADPELPIVGPRLAAEGVANTLAGRQFNTMLLSGFALLALVLAAAGIYGLMAYAVTLRTREIGIRLAIGATATDVLQLVMGQTARIAVVGLAIGLIGALALTRVLRTLLFDVSPLDPITFSIAAVMLFGIAVLAGYLPARRAAKIDPQSAIRGD